MLPPPIGTIRKNTSITDGSTSSTVQARYAEVLAEQHGAARNRPREQIGDRLVVHFVGDERRAVEHAEHRHDEPDVQQPDHHAEDRRPADRRAVDAERPTRAAIATMRTSDGEHAPGRRAARQKHRPPRPQHLAERQIEDPQRRRHERRSARRGTARHDFTRYWKTACRLSSGDVTSWIAPSSPDAASVGQPRVERVRAAPVCTTTASSSNLQAEHVVVGEELARERARLVGLDVARCADARRSDRESGGRCLRRGSAPG